MIRASRSADHAVASDGVLRAMQLLPDVVLGKPPSLAHCIHMLDRYGMTQFSRGATPDLDYGYCVDDNARAFLAAIITLYLDPRHTQARQLGEAALHFMEECRRPDGRFHNLMAADGSFTDEVGSADSLGRLMWACGVAVTCAPTAAWRARAGNLLSSALEHTADLTGLRPIAYAILGLAALVSPALAAPIPPSAGAAAQPFDRKAKLELERLTSALAAQLERNAREDWVWFEPELTWGNARLPEALLRAGGALENKEFVRAGLRALQFLASVTHENDTFVPIGNRGWYERGGRRAIYDQQPIEACAMADAWLAAARLTDPVEYESKALEAFAWFLGLNTGRVAVVDLASGGSRDGLEQERLNMNMGAESTLSYVHAHASLAAYFRQKSSNGP